MQWEPHEWFEDKYYAEWFLYPEYVVTDPAPTVTAATPSAAAAGATVTITGTNFTGTTAVRFGSTPATGFTVVSATQLTAVVPAGTAGSAPIQVSKGSTSSATFPYTRGA
ncbi:IPT/TIG domain-containing protein [Pseudoclavibacter helvolus]